MVRTETEPRGGSTKTLLIAASCAVVLLGVFLYLLMGGTTSTTERPQDRAQNPLEAAQKALEKENDVTTIRSALEKINAYAQTSAKHPPTLDRETRDQLQKRFDLDERAGQIAEIEGDTYTLLDAHHLDQCFLLRDAAQALEAESRNAGERLTPLDQATKGFAWVVRQIRLEEGIFPAVPPQFALRRGWGTDIDRALVFLALLEQMGEDGRSSLRGCLVGWPSKDGWHLWACGVLVGDEPKIYLFDPRLGLPLPGPNGNGVATLAEVRKDPKVLSQLTVKPENAYDVTQQMAQDMEIYQYCPLSALAPRMRFLQNELLAPSVRVHLWVDALADEKKLKAAAAADEKPVAVKVLPAGHVLLRTFLPKEEGGTDGTILASLNQIRGFVEGANQRPIPLPQRQAFELELTPWFELPPDFRDQEKFPFNIGLGQVVRDRFAAPFRHFTLDPQQGRDLMLRGHYEDAIKMLTGERQVSIDHLRQWQKLKDTPDWQQRFANWLVRAQQAFAADLRAKKENNAAAQEDARKAVEAMWKEDIIWTVLNGFIAATRVQETTYYLALCKHELAEQAQLRLDLMPQTKGMPPEKATVEWGDALYWWQQFDDYPKAPQREAARRLYGRAQLMHGESGDREAAIKIWETDFDGPKHPLETVACLYLAAQARKK